MEAALPTLLPTLGEYFLKMIAVTSVLAIPLEPATLLAVKSAPAWAVAVTAACAAFLSALFDHWFVRRTAHQIAWIERQRQRKFFQRAEGWAAKSPFLMTFSFAALPVPFTIARILVPLSGYPVRRYATAVALGRLPRIYVIAVFGTLFEIPDKVLIVVFVATLVIAVVVAAIRYLTRPRVQPEPEPRSTPTPP